jgi:chromo domain-containing protein 1
LDDDFLQLTDHNALPLGKTHSEQTAGFNNWRNPPMHETPIISGTNADSASLSCLNFQKMVGNACKLNFGDLFGDEQGGKMLAQTAFLMFHPRDHAKELELITRWLHLHHVEVGNVWLDGAWEHFKQNIVGGGTGVIIVSLLPIRCFVS